MCVSVFSFTQYQFLCFSYFLSLSLCVCECWMYTKFIFRTFSKWFWHQVLRQVYIFDSNEKVLPKKNWNSNYFKFNIFVLTNANDEQRIQWEIVVRRMHNGFNVFSLFVCCMSPCKTSSDETNAVHVNVYIHNPVWSLHKSERAFTMSAQTISTFTDFYMTVPCTRSFAFYSYKVKRLKRHRLTCKAHLHAHSTHPSQRACTHLMHTLHIHTHYT